MADIRAFRGLGYNPAKIKNFGDVITPPYDVISPEQRQEFLARNPWNVVRLILPEGESPYENARQTMQSWIEQQVLLFDERPGIYTYQQKYKTPEGEEKVRNGFLCRVRIEEYEKGIVLPHESTLFAPKEDRLKLLRACKANFGPIFSLYTDPEIIIDSLLSKFTVIPPRIIFDDDAGITNSLWYVSDPDLIAQVTELMKSRWILIADGHHRYESCMAYRDEMRKENSDPYASFQFTLMFLSNIDHPGITVLPYNRGILNLSKFEPGAILQRSKKYFEVREFEDREQALFSMKRAGSDGTAFLALMRDTRGVYLFKLKSTARLDDLFPPGIPAASRHLDVNILHRVFIQEILSISEEDIREQKFLKYYKDAKEELKDFDSGRLQLAFFMNPTRVEQVVEVSRSGGKMPQKSTFFYPKVMTGLVINSHGV